MKFRSRAWVSVWAAALLVVPLGGCNTSQVRVRLPGFANGNTDGIWFWRLEGSTYKRICRFDLSNAYVSGGKEVVDYQQSCLDSRPASAPWQATVERLPGDTQTVTLVLTYQRAGTATAPHRASAFNPAGESALSTGTLGL